jgi:YrbI family 3-deoxy-D-manno-octulosonate 8-phosphate phosphatase
MTVLAVIPARGGSKGIPGKNLREVGGRSLVERAVLACRGARLVDRVIVTTDSPDIANAAIRSGAEVVWRPAELSGDHCTSESALQHALSAADLRSESTIVVFVQCTSPFIASSDLDASIERVVSGECDVVFSAVSHHGFVWAVTSESAVGVNHDASTRQRRQDRPDEVVETGAFYVMTREGFERSGHRFHGTVVPRLVDPLHRIEIDDPADLLVAQHLAPLVDPVGVASLDRAAVQAMVTDFDGVHTSNRATVDEFGNESVEINRSDGLGLAELRKAGIPVMILSTERNPVVQRRAEKLGIECLSGVDDKSSRLAVWAAERDIDLAHVVYVGNDLNDLGCLQLVGHPVVVADAHPAVRMLPGVRVTTLAGGAGAVREVTDAVLRARGHAANEISFPQLQGA